MTAPQVLETLKTSNGRTTSEVLTTDNAGTAAGHWLAIIYGSDYRELANMPDPTSSAGTPQHVYSLDIGTNIGHIKAYLLEITSNGAKTITIPTHIDSDIFGVVLRLDVAVTVDDVDGAIDATETQTAHVAPSLDTTGVDRLLVGIWLGTDVNTGWSSPPYQAPGSMVERAQPHTSPFAAMMVATEEVSAAGATGTRTATFFRQEKWGSISLALAGPAASGVQVSGTVYGVAAGSVAAKKVVHVGGSVSAVVSGSAAARKRSAASGGVVAAAAATAAARKTAHAGTASVCGLASASTAAAKRTAASGVLVAVATGSATAGTVRVVAGGVYGVAATAGTARTRRHAGGPVVALAVGHAVLPRRVPVSGVCAAVAVGWAELAVPDIGGTFDVISSGSGAESVMSVQPGLDW
ncbi:hypothetical protein [Nonomuraea endophytica]|uniref:hypothetical protein n=1 Tax=Nonomuraea endophytica TaxID=714136 RepID=UPI0037C88553